MTKVTFTYNADGRYVGFSAEGHAGYAITGYDIVCAAISALTQYTVIGIMDVVEAESVVIDETLTVRLGITVSEEDAVKQSMVDILIRTLQRTLEAIQEEYPNNVLIATKLREE